MILQTIAREMASAKEQLKLKEGDGSSLKVKSNDAEVQIQNADNTLEQATVTNPTDMGNNNDLVAETINNGGISFLSELLINQSFVSDEERKDDNNENKSFISDQ